MSANCGQYPSGCSKMFVMDGGWEFERRQSPRRWRSTCRRALSTNRRLRLS